MNWLFYLLEANVYLVVFFAFYKLLLQRETFYGMNRFFLILSSGLSFLLPLVKLGSLNRGQARVRGTNTVEAMLEENIFRLENVLTGIYILIVLIGVARLFLKLVQIRGMIQAGSVSKVGSIYLIPSTQSLPFSFFNYLFLNPKAENQGTILSHESVHIRQGHSADILYFEFLAIFNWFNPFVRLMQQEIRAIHEFLADEEASSRETSVDEYALFLIRNSCASQNEYPTNQMFNRSLLKKRIIMLSKKKSPPASRLKYGLMLMVVPVLVCMSSMALNKSYGLDLASFSSGHQDSSKIKNEKASAPAKKAAATKKKYPEPRVEQVKFSARDKGNKPASKQKFPEPKVEQVKFSAKPAQVQKTGSKKKYPEPKVEQAKFSAKPAQVQKSGSKKKYPEPTIEVVKFTAKSKPAPKSEPKKGLPKEEAKRVPPPPPVEAAGPATTPPAEPKVMKVPPPPPPMVEKVN